MPWKKTAPRTEQERFATLAQTGRFTVGELCHDFGINRKTGHRGLKRQHSVILVANLESSLRCRLALANRAAVSRLTACGTPIDSC